MLPKKRVKVSTIINSTLVACWTYAENTDDAKLAAFAPLDRIRFAIKRSFLEVLFHVASHLNTAGIQADPAYKYILLHELNYGGNDWDHFIS